MQKVLTISFWCLKILDIPLPPAESAAVVASPPATSPVPQLSGAVCSHSKISDWLLPTVQPLIVERFPISVKQFYALFLEKDQFWARINVESNYTGKCLYKRPKLSILAGTVASGWSLSASGCCQVRGIDCVSPITHKLTTKKSAPVHQDHFCTTHDGYDCKYGVF